MKRKIRGNFSCYQMNSNNISIKRQEYLPKAENLIQLSFGAQKLTVWELSSFSTN